MRFQFSPIMFVVVCLFTGLAHAAPDYWSEPVVAKNALDAGTGRRVMLDVGALRRHIDAQGEGATLTVPQPDGGYGEFALFDSGTMPPELAKKFPEIRSYKGFDAKGNEVRIDISPIGLQAMVFTHDGESWAVQPEDLDANAAVALKHFDVGVHAYRVLRLADMRSGDFRCDVEDSHDRRDTFETSKATQYTFGANRRNLRIAIAATGEYTKQYGGTVSGGLAAITSALNLINQIYERDLNVHLTLVSTNDRIVYTNELLDPYPLVRPLTENQLALDLAIGNGNYDIGHLFIRDAGQGQATVGVVCNSLTKARGFSATSLNPASIFYLVAAHEIAHQLGAAHTFNSETGSCGGGNRTASSAFEPGSGSTIMGYTGHCLSNDLQMARDPYFHVVSLISMANKLSSVTCGTTLATPNRIPSLSVPTQSFVIPAKTPFALNATASDPDGDALTFTWEQYNLGSATNIGIDNGTSPIIRSYLPQASGTRVVPRLSNLVSNTFAPGEILPQVARSSLTFYATARDNHPGGGAAVAKSLAIQVADTGAPFAVTAPNTALTWTGGSTQTVTWNVAGTTAPPIACANVNIHLSKDGGNTFPIALASNVANSGTGSITVPAGSTTQARVRVQCSGNIFFDMSNVNFTIN